MEENDKINGWQVLMVLAVGLVSLYCYWTYLEYSSSGEATRQLFAFFTGRNYDLGFLFYPAFASGLIGVQILFLYKELLSSLLLILITAALGTFLAPITLLVGPFIVSALVLIALFRYVSKFI